MSSFRLPSASQRILILGRNGSGKSRAAVWHLAQKDFAAMPWIVLNHKRDKFINAIPGAVKLQLDQIPTQGGLYVYEPMPMVDDERVTALLYEVYDRENMGIYIDEGYMIDKNDPALTAVITQGRSKHIPMITLSQRPTNINRFLVSEADFFQVFHLVDKRDRQTVNAFIPRDLEELMGGDTILPQFHSVYHDVSINKTVIMSPVTTDAEILAIFQQKLMPPPDSLESDQKTRLVFL